MFLEENTLAHGGMALVLVKDGEIIYDTGFSGMTSDTVIPIASASKWLSAGVIMALVDDGVLSLDDTASDYLPHYTGAHGEMTVRQMFSHTSGLPAHSSSTDFPGSDDILGNRKITLAESVDQIAEVELIAEPGTQFVYGGLSMQVAGRIAEIASGKGWLELFTEKVADPLDMEETDYNGLGQTTNPRIAGSIQTSAHQYARFLDMLLSGGLYKGTRILSPDAVEEMLRDQTQGVPIVDSPWQGYMRPPPVADEVRYGIGCWREVISESGSIREASSQGAFGFSPWIDVERNLAGVLAVKSRASKIIPVYLEMKEIIRDIIDSPVKDSDQENSITELYHPEPGLYTVEVIEHHVIYDAQRKKELQLCITYPEEEGTYPLILFSHSWRTSKDMYQSLVHYWVSHGYVCIQMNHSDSLELSDLFSEPDDFENRPLDISFVIDSLDELQISIPDIQGKIDTEHIGVGGHSFGANTAQLVGGAVPVRGHSFEDRSIQAVTMISGWGTGTGLDAHSWDTFIHPLLIITGTNDDCDRTGNTWQWRTEPYVYAPPGISYLVVIEGAYHGYGGITREGDPGPKMGPSNEEHVLFVKTITLAFWDAYLKNDAAALAFLDPDLIASVTSGVVSLSRK